MKKTIPLLAACALLTIILSAGAVSQDRFLDVEAGTWYYDAVGFVTDRGLFNGTSESYFSPRENMTRGMFVTVLGRYAGISQSEGSLGRITKSGVNLRSAPNTSSSILAVLDAQTLVQIKGTSGEWYKVKYGSLTGYVRNDLMEIADTSFADVPEGRYYSEYIDWAYQNGIVSGTSPDTFSPDQSISREQICAILSNYASFVNLKLKPVTEKALFKDDSGISTWASDAVYTLQQAGVITGRDTGAFDPKASANRAEVAAIIQRFIQAVSYKPEPAPSFAPDGSYVYGTAMPETAAVSDAYFDDACFIGHSFVVGMEQFFNLPNADFLGINGISASSMLTYDKFELRNTYMDEEGNEIPEEGTLEEVLKERVGEYGKIYIVLGTNELGPNAYHLNTYYNSVSSLVDIVKSTQPDAKVYLLATIPVSKGCSENSANFNRDNIIDFNLKLKQISKEKNVVYLDVFTLFADGDGYLPDGYCLSDGIHILSPQYTELKKFLKSHTLQ